MTEHPEWSDVSRDPKYPPGWWILPGLAIGGLFLALVLLSGCASVNAATDYAPVANVVTIHDDPGGPIGDYIRIAADIKRNGESVKLDGRCASACTILTSVGTDKICVTDKASLVFHSASDPRANGVLMAYYPTQVQEWLTERGGLTPALITLEGPELRQMFRSCS